MNILFDMQDLMTNLLVERKKEELSSVFGKSTAWVLNLANGNHVLTINQGVIDGLHKVGYDICLVEIEKSEDGQREYRPVRFSRSSQEEKERFNDLV